MVRCIVYLYLLRRRKCAGGWQARIQRRQSSQSTTEVTPDSCAAGIEQVDRDSLKGLVAVQGDAGEGN